MAYGRLDVFWPDGQFRTFQLSENNISIGRSSGNSIMLEADNISRYHISLTHENAQVILTDMDSANGTFVDGVRLERNATLPLLGGEEIQIGELRIVYNFLDESPTRPILVPEDTTQRIELEAPAFRIDINGPHQGVAPGANISAEVTITNTGTSSQRFVVEVTGVPPEWVRVDRKELEVREAGVDQVVINFRPVRRPDTVPGQYNVTVIVRPKTDSGVMLRGELHLVILPYSGFGMALEQRELDTEGRLRLHIHNQGSAPLPLQFASRAPETLKVSLQPDKITLAPGQRLIVHGVARPTKRPLWGEPDRQSFDVEARSLDPAAFVTSQRAYVTIKPPLPRWAPLAALGLFGSLALLLILGVAGLLAIRPTPTPSVERFLVSSAQVNQGEQVMVDWGASNADTVTVTVNGTPVYTDEDGGEGTYTLNTMALNGPVTISVLAQKGDKTDIANSQLQVTVPLRVDLFTVNPPTVIRNVVQPLTIEWAVSGATRTTIEGLEAFTSTSIQPVNSDRGKLDSLIGIPRDMLVLTLLAAGPNGESLEQTISVSVIDPTCAADGDVRVYGAPGESDRVISTVPDGTNVVMDAQDTTGQWLRVTVAGGLKGWAARSEFTCDDRYLIGNLQQAIDVPTVVPVTITPNATSTPNPTATRPTPTTAPTRQPTAQPSATASS